MLLNKPIHLVDMKYAVVREVEDFEIVYKNSVILDTLSSESITCNIDEEYMKYGAFNCY